MLTGHYLGQGMATSHFKMMVVGKQKKKITTNGSLLAPNSHSQIHTSGELTISDQTHILVK